MRFRAAQTIENTSQCLQLHGEKNSPAVTKTVHKGIWPLTILWWYSVRLLPICCIACTKDNKILENVYIKMLRF